MPDPNDVLLVIQQWVQKAENDLQTATHTLQLEEDCPTDTVCFHAQQCEVALRLPLRLRYRDAQGTLRANGTIPFMLSPSLPVILSVGAQCRSRRTFRINYAASTAESKYARLDRHYRESRLQEAKALLEELA